LLKYGPHGGGHGHPDKLNLILHANGERLSPDFGTPGYGLELFQSWYRQTASHNTVTLEGLSQPPATGTLHSFRPDGDFQIADASVAWQDDGTEAAGITPYVNSWLRRVILARPEYFLDILLVGSEASRRIDWLYHNQGTPHVSLSGQPIGMTSDEGAGYQHNSQAQRAVVEGDFVVTWPPMSDRPSAAGLKLFVAGGIEGEAITGMVPGNPPTDPYGLLIHRRQAKTTAFLSLFHPYQSAPQVTRVEWSGHFLVEDGWAGCVVHCADRREEWLIRLSTAAQSSLPPLKRQAAARFEYTIDQL
jgi:hypothetical protein